MARVLRDIATVAVAAAAFGLGVVVGALVCCKMEEPRRIPLLYDSPFDEAPYWLLLACSLLLTFVAASIGVFAEFAQWLAARERKQRKGADQQDTGASAPPSG